MDIRYVVHGVTVALAWFAAVNLLFTAIVVAVSRYGARRDAPRSAAAWLALRLLPAAASIAFVAVLFVPSYWEYEPRVVEDLDVTLAAIAFAALAVIGAGALRGVGALRRAAQRTRTWLRAARPIPLDAAIPAYEVPIDAPMMALVGVIRPRLIITRGVVSALTIDELRAAVAHEIGHLRAWDNLKRLAMVAAPDLLAGSRSAGSIETRWASAAEHAADHAAGDDSERRCALASALVKVAKLTPLSTPLAEPISTLVDGGDIASRVQCLLDDSPARPLRLLPRLACGAAIAGGFAAAYVPLLRVVHEATEIIVNTLP